MSKAALKPINGLPLFEGQAFMMTGSKNAESPDILKYQHDLKHRFSAQGAHALSDQNVLELLLFRALPKCNVTPVAERLLDAFGDLNGVLTSSSNALRNVRGVGAAVALDLKLIEATAHRMARARSLDQPVLSDWQALLDYCHTTMAHRNTEQARVLYLNSSNRLIEDEEQGDGTVDHAPIYPREIMKRALDLGATARILVHNHPTGDPTPSKSDIDMTHQIEDAAQTLGITLHDHLIIGKSRELSFRSEGLI